MYDVRRFAFVSCIILGWLFGGFFHSEALGQEIVDEVNAQERQEVLDEAVNPFIHALQTGDTQSLDRLIGGKLAKMLGKLIRSNTEYPKFLRQRYGGTTVRDTIKIFQRRDANNNVVEENSGQQRIAVVHMQTPEGVHDNFELSLWRDKQGSWKIVDKKVTE